MKGIDPPSPLKQTGFPKYEFEELLTDSDNQSAISGAAHPGAVLLILHST